MTADPYQAAQASAARLAELSGQDHHDVVVVLGSGFAPAAAGLGPVDAEIPLADLGGFPPPTVPGHVAMARSLAVGQVRVLVYLGRVHLYEGHEVASVVHGVRTAAAAGCRVVVLTNAAGGIRAGYRPGQPVLIRAYSLRLRALAHGVDPTLAEGVYAALPGPHYETPAEIRMLRVLGADLVGMSTVLEAIAARHLGMEVLAISLVTNLAAGLTDHGLDHGEVVTAGAEAAGRMGGLLAGILPEVAPPVSP